MCGLVVDNWIGRLELDRSSHMLWNKVVSNFTQSSVSVCSISTLRPSLVLRMQYDQTKSGLTFPMSSTMESGGCNHVDAYDRSRLPCRRPETMCRLVFNGVEPFNGCWESRVTTRNRAVRRSQC